VVFGDLLDGFDSPAGLYGQFGFEAGIVAKALGFCDFWFSRFDFIPQTTVLLKFTPVPILGLHPRFGLSEFLKQVLHLLKFFWFCLGEVVIFSQIFCEIIKTRYPSPGSCSGR
jgi:hypothetical protein